jgi:hypothetical protein
VVFRSLCPIRIDQPAPPIKFATAARKREGFPLVGHSKSQTKAADPPSRGASFEIRTSKAMDPCRSSPGLKERPGGVPAGSREAATTTVSRTTSADSKAPASARPTACRREAGGGFEGIGRERRRRDHQEWSGGGRRKGLSVGGLREDHRTSREDGARATSLVGALPVGGTAPPVRAVVPEASNSILLDGTGPTPLLSSPARALDGLLPSPRTRGESGSPPASGELSGPGCSTRPPTATPLSTLHCSPAAAIRQRPTASERPGRPAVGIPPITLRVPTVRPPPKPRTQPGWRRADPKRPRGRPRRPAPSC